MIFPKIPNLKLELLDFFKLSWPISSTRVVLSLLHSIEAMIIPIFLMHYGMTFSMAISIYGTMLGMSMPFIMFPSAITNALSAMLLPSISSLASKNDFASIRRTASLALKYSLSMGIFFTVFFVVFGNSLGYEFFNSKLAGEFIMILAWLCPLIYVEMTLSGIINGFGLTKITFKFNMFTALIRIVFLVFLFPNTEF